MLGSKLVTKEKLEKALAIQGQKGGNLGKILISEGFITQRDLMITLSREFNIPPINLSKYKIDPKVIKLVSENFARHYVLIPISRIGNRLTVATADPLNIFATDDIKTMTNCDVDVVIATEDDIKDAIDSHYKSGKGKKDFAEMIDDDPDREGKTPSGTDKDEPEAEKSGDETSVVQLIDLVISEAINKRASDIHIEPQERSLRIRYRIDGKLEEAFNLPKENQNAALARIKIMSRLDITESRLPQDGRFKVRYRDKEIDFRVSILPVTHGNKIVLRLLDKSNLSVGLEKLGFLTKPLTELNKALKKPYGMVLVTGPTGSGKSTTLYSVLNRLNTPEKAIITIEDPVEYQVDGITQIQANPEIGLSFANGLRSILRQSPDVIMIGEIRDIETADIAIKASLTGVLVFSTLHTNDAASALTRLIDMGVEPFLIASSVCLVMAQRLCRRICPDCKEPVKIPRPVLLRVGLDPEKLAAKGKEPVFYKGKGCTKCGSTGYYGRMGTLEALVIDDKIRDMTIHKKQASEIKDYAVKQGMKALKDNALEKFIAGSTTLEEVLRITSE